MRRFATLVLALLACSADAGGSGSTGSTGSASTAQAPTTAEGVSTDDGDDGVISPGFLDEPDLRGVNIECDVWTQDCRAGEKCVAWANDGGNAWNATKCTPIDPNPAAPGERCSVVGSGVSGVDNCGVASMCWDVDPDTQEGVCVAFFAGSESGPFCDDPEANCTIPSDGTLILCLPTCDPVQQDCDDKGFDDNGCYPSQETFVCLVVAAGPDEGGHGSPCASVNGCDHGLFCAKAEIVPGCTDSGCCSEFCDVTDPDASAKCAGADAGQVCIPWFSSPPGAPSFLDHVGACALPV